MEERGAALVLVLLVLVLMSALGLGVSLMSTTEVLVAANALEGQQALYFAEAGLAVAAADLERVADWTSVLSGETRSSFVDGPGAGPRTLVSGEVIDLTLLVNLATCGKSTCSPADLTAATVDRPWGVNNPRYRLFAHGPASRFPSDLAGDAPYYLVVMVADDPSETDADPTRDGVGPDDPGRGVILLRATAFGPRGVRRTVAATIARAGAPPSERGYTGQLAGGETNERRSRRVVGTPGATLGRTTIGPAVPRP